MAHNLMHFDSYAQQSFSFFLPQDFDGTKAEAKSQGGIVQKFLLKKPGTDGKELPIQ